MCPYVQANSRCLGDASVCHHGDNAEVQLHETPPAFTGCAHRGETNCSVLQSNLKLAEELEIVSLFLHDLASIAYNVSQLIIV